MRRKNEVVKCFDELAEEWSQRYGESNPLRNYLFIVRKKRVEELLDRDVGPGLRVLDIGCGSGVMAPYFAQKGAIYFGIDISEKMVAGAKKKFFRFSKRRNTHPLRKGM
jgi:2-polyprenyl-3-methyl-5-hydroxy-6-metoxy-1,4-benzoquinol methylase